MCIYRDSDCAAHCSVLVVRLEKLTSKIISTQTQRTQFQRSRKKDLKKSDPTPSTASGHAQVSDVAKSGQKQSRKIFVGHELRWTCGHREALCQKDQFTDDCKCHHICCKLGSKEKPKKSTDVSNGKILDYTDRFIN